jgi:hypothetical protein
MRLPAPLPVDLLTFFRTGHFDCLRIGQDRETILHNFPDPDDWWAGAPMERAPIWRYGHVELHFADERLWMIFSDYVDALDGGPSLAIDRWILARPEQTLLDVMSALNREHIDFAKTTHALGARPHAYVKLELASGVELQFDHRDDPLEHDDPNAMRLGAFSLQR